MRRGLIAWSKDEVPVAALDARVERLQAAMIAERLDALLLYTSFARPAAVSYLTHFVPYWNEALLVVLPVGAPVLLASFSKRVHPWIREVSHVGEVLAAPDLGRAAAGFLRETLPVGARVGALEPDALPCSVAEPIASSLVDATELFARVRQPADRFEKALAKRAETIATRTLDMVPGDAKRASPVLAALEAAARLQGAEEVIVRLALDLVSDPAPRRIEGEAALGERYAIEVSLAYKGMWVRVARSLPLVEQAEEWFRAALSDASAQGPRRQPPGMLAAWTLESQIGSSPLSVVAHEKRVERRLPEGSSAVLSARLEVAGAAWYGAAPLVIGA